MMKFNAGDVLLGKYRIERVLGAGGMGVVVAAFHLQLEERVAIKFLLPDALVNPESLERFAREARAAVKIKSEHVARVFDVGTLDTGAPYMVMELLDGEDLSALVGRIGPLPVQDAIDYVLQATEALAEAHAIGIIHRDLKPSNLFLTRRADGSACVKVLDFGISKYSAPGSSGNLDMTKTHAIMGSPLYMSPEQMASTRDVDARADIWATGVVLYELLSGQQPFQATTMPELCAQVLQKEPANILDLRADLPQELVQVLLRCLAKQRDQRFAHVGELARALAPFASRGAAKSAERIWNVLSVAGITSGSLTTMVVSERPAAEAPPKSTPRPMPKSRIWMVLSALALGLVAVGILLGTRSTSTTPATTSPLRAAPEPIPEPETAKTLLPGPALPSASASASATEATVEAAPEPPATVVPTPVAASPRREPERATGAPAAKRASASTQAIAVPKAEAVSTKAPAAKPPAATPSDDDVLRGRR
jgi:serine/threonine-protein kinase